MPNLPMARELEAQASLFHELLSRPLTGLIAGPGLTRAESPSEMFRAVDTRVFVRARPILAHEPDKVTTIRRVDGMRNCIFMSPELTVACEPSVQPTSLPVDATFADSDSNRTVYTTACNGLLPMAVAGGSAAVLCYGQTGSGKTYTTLGMLQCVAQELEALLQADGNVSAVVSFIEARAEGCRDLSTGSTAVQILEDKSGAVQVYAAEEILITSAAQLEDLCVTAIANRSTKCTVRNASGSSRSHMAVRFIFRRNDTPWVAPGVLCFVDLAGSESAADAAGHDKDRIAETRFINASLMTLKECIRARGESCVSRRHVHIPFRQSKLTLLLRDSFEIIVGRQTKTAVIACVSPLLRDARHTYNTLRYAALLYVSPKSGVIVAADRRDPITWTREEALSFISNASNGRIQHPETILSAGDGRALAALPEAIFVQRATQGCGLGPKAAKEVYNRVWKAVIDAKKLNRNAIKRAKEHAIARHERDAIARHATDRPMSATPQEVKEGSPSKLDSIVTSHNTRLSPQRTARRRPNAMLMEEKENDDYLEALSREMTRGHSTTAAGARRPAAVDSTSQC